MDMLGISHFCPLSRGCPFLNSSLSMENWVCPKMCSAFNSLHVSAIEMKREACPEAKFQLIQSILNTRTHTHTHTHTRTHTHTQIGQVQYIRRRRTFRRLLTIEIYMGKESNRDLNLRRKIFCNTHTYHWHGVDELQQMNFELSKVPPDDSPAKQREVLISHTPTSKAALSRSMCTHTYILGHTPSNRPHLLW